MEGRVLKSTLLNQVSLICAREKQSHIFPIFLPPQRLQETHVSQGQSETILSINFKLQYGKCMQAGKKFAPLFIAKQVAGKFWHLS